jgi:alpha-tubulin suppressor-like RCC1 family protein
MENVKNAYIGRAFSFVLLNDGRLYSFGDNFAGQCGTGKDSGKIIKPRLIMNHVIEAAAGHIHGIALQSNGDLWIWGGDYGISVDRFVEPYQFSCRNITDLPR